MKRSLLGKILERQQKLKPAAESTEAAEDQQVRPAESTDAARSSGSSEAVEDQQVRPAAEQWLQVWHDRLAAKVEEEEEKRKKEFEQNSKKHWYSKMVRSSEAVEDQQVRPAAEQWLQVWHDRLAAKVEEGEEKRKKEFEQRKKGKVQASLR